MPKGGISREIEVEKNAIESKTYRGSQNPRRISDPKKNEALNYMRLANRIDSVVSQVQTAIQCEPFEIDGFRCGGIEQGAWIESNGKGSLIMDKFEDNVENLNANVVHANQPCPIQPSWRLQANKWTIWCSKLLMSTDSSLKSTWLTLLRCSYCSRNESDPLTERLAKLRNS